MNNIPVLFKHVYFLNSLDRLDIELLQGSLKLLVVGSCALVNLLNLSPWSSLSTTTAISLLLHERRGPRQKKSFLPCLELWCMRRRYLPYKDRHSISQKSFGFPEKFTSSHHHFYPSFHQKVIFTYQYELTPATSRA